MTFCLLHRQKKNDLEVSVFNSIKNVNQKDWKSVVKQKNIYQSIDYLSALEDTLSTSIVFRYLMFYNSEAKAVAIAIVQSLAFEDKGKNDQQHVCEIRHKVKQHVLKSFDLRVMTCGSPFASGENGFAFTDDISNEFAYKNLSKALLQLQKTEKDNIKAQVILIKEFWPQSYQASNKTLKDDFRDFEIDVNMVIDIPHNWKSMNDYLQAMTTKFRTKAKSAFKKSKNLTVRDFSVVDTEKYKTEIQSLYLSVIEKSPFRFGVLQAETFVALKKNLGDNFILKGYFLEEKLVGFCSSFISNNIIDANYVGINYSLNRSHAIYQRMLYDYVEIAIEHKCSELRFGRTAEEIKSTIGALPVPMNLYIRHKNSITNKFLKPIFASIKPSPFELRKPFKTIAT